MCGEDTPCDFRRARMLTRESQGRLSFTRSAARGLQRRTRRWPHQVQAQETAIRGSSRQSRALCVQALPAACRALTGSKSARVSVVDDLWVPLKLFATIAAQLGVGERLAPLLDRKTLHAWSLDDGEEGGILHNWKIPAQLISPNSYSTNAMLECVWPRSPRVQYDLADTYLDMSYSVDFDHMVMLAESVQLRTPLDRNSIRLDYTFRSDRSGGPTSFEVLLAQSVLRGMEGRPGRRRWKLRFGCGRVSSTDRRARQRHPAPLGDQDRSRIDRLDDRLTLHRNNCA